MSPIGANRIGWRIPNRAVNDVEIVGDPTSPAERERPAIGLNSSHDTAVFLGFARSIRYDPVMAIYAQPDPTNVSADAIRAFVVGTVIGIIVVGGFSGGLTYLFGGGMAGALAVGAFTALWGGPGFGGMMGFIVHQDRMQKAQDAGGGGHSRSVTSSSE